MSGKRIYTPESKARLLATRLKPRTFEEQIPFFWNLVDKRGPDECWPWIGCKVKQGYGRWRCDGRFISSHRYSFILHYGADPLPLLVCHTCDNPPCCNPDHFFVGTKKDNADDRDAKGRNINLRGEAHANAILNNTQVIEIRSRYRPRRTSQLALAKQYGVSEHTIGNILRKTSWRHL